MKFSIAEAEDLVSSIFERNGVLPQNARSVAKALVASGLQAGRPRFSAYPRLCPSGAGWQGQWQCAAGGKSCQTGCAVNRR